MAQAKTGFDALRDLARKLGIGFVSGPLQPPDHGRMWIEKRRLDEILQPWIGRRVALGIMPGGPGIEQILTGTTTLDAEGLAQLEQVVADVGGDVYQGRLEQLTPADWLQWHSDPQSQDDIPGVGATPASWPDNAEGAEIRGFGTGPLLDRARATGWPATFGDEPVLFLGDQPLYHLLMRESVGRNVTLLLGEIAD